MFPTTSRWILVLALLAQLWGCQQKSIAGAGSQASASPSSTLGPPREPELEEVKNAPYYAGFKTIPWPHAARLVHTHQVLWIEENQAGLAFLTTIAEAGYDGEKYVTKLPRGTDLVKLTRDAQTRAGSQRVVKYLRYSQISWKRAVALLRGEEPGHVIASIFDAHFERVFLHSKEGAEFLAIETSPNALVELLREVDPNHTKYTYVVE